MMNAISEFFSAHWLQVLGYTLLHSLWESFIVTALIIFSLRFIPLKSSNVRYLVASFGMLVIVLFSIGTFVYLFSNGESTTYAVSVKGQQPSWTMNKVASSPGMEGYFSQAKNIVQACIPFFLTVWLIGTFLFCLRILAALFYIEKLKGNSVTLQNEWSRYIQILARQLSIDRIILLAESTSIQVPVVVGYLKPMILIPLGMCSSLSTEQLETIFLHELMHIRRKDYLVNLLQG